MVIRHIQMGHATTEIRLGDRSSAADGLQSMINTRHKDPSAGLPKSVK